MINYNRWWFIKITQETNRRKSKTNYHGLYCSQNSYSENKVVSNKGEDVCYYDCYYDYFCVKFFSTFFYAQNNVSKHNWSSFTNPSGEAERFNSFKIYCVLLNLQKKVYYKCSIIVFEFFMSFLSSLQSWL